MDGGNSFVTQYAPVNGIINMCNAFDAEAVGTNGLDRQLSEILRNESKFVRTSNTGML